MVSTFITHRLSFSGVGWPRCGLLGVSLARVVSDVMAITSRGVTIMATTSAVITRKRTVTRSSGGVVALCAKGVSCAVKLLGCPPTRPLPYLVASDSDCGFGVRGSCIGIVLLVPVRERPRIESVRTVTAFAAVGVFRRP